MNILKISKLSVMSIPLLSAGTISLIPSVNSHIISKNKNNKNYDNKHIKNTKKQSYNMSYQTYLNQTQDHVNNYKDNNLYNRLGYGYDITNGTSTGYSIFDTFNHAASVSIKPKNISGSFDCVRSSNKLVQELGVNANLRFGFKKLSASTSVDFFTKSESSTQSISLVFDIKATVDMEFNYYGTQINRVAKDQISHAENDNSSKHPWSNFEKLYSNKFIRHETAKREVFLNLKINSESSKIVSQLKAAFQFNYSLASLKATIQKMQRKDTHNMSLKMNYTMLPVTKNDDILPASISLTTDNFSTYMAQLENNASKFVTDFDTDAKNSPDNADNWYPSAINTKQDLTDYSILDFKIKSINNYLYLMKKYPELNKYFDEAISLNEDSMYIEKNKDILRPDPENGNILTRTQNIIKEFNQSYNDLFSKSSEINDLLNNHKEGPILNKVEEYSNNIKKIWSIIKNCRLYLPY